jgi:splicing factor 3A subunit 1
MALNLPKPVHSYAGEDDLKNLNGKVSVEDVEDEGEYRPPRMSDKYLKGIIYPPPEMRSEFIAVEHKLTTEIIDKTAMAVAKTSKPQVLEDKIRESQTTDPRFAFLNDEDPYYQYYRWKVEYSREEMEDQAKGLTTANGTPTSSTPAPAAAKPIHPELIGYEPKQWEFKVDLPGVTAQDLDILRLTALFHARRGRSFLSALSVREGRNYQFDFLRPTHSLYGYYNRMVESYQKVMQPAPGQIEEIIRADADPEAKWKTLEEARKRALWEEGKRARDDVKAAEKMEEEEAMAVIDWQDFVTVETIEFTQADMELDLPPPSSNDKLKEMSMAERRMAAMIMEEPAAQGAADGDEMELEEDEEDEEARIERVKAEREQQRTRDVQRAALEKKGVKIKKDYVPKGELRTKAELTSGIQRGGPVATSKCPYCGQSIPEAELSEHIRIELLDPRWKDQKRELEARRQQQQQLQVGADISTSLRNLAAARTDLFGDEEDEETRKLREEEAARKRKEREKIVWDGHTASASRVQDTFKERFSAEDRRRKAQEAAGVADGPVNTVGPQVGPGIKGGKTSAPMQPKAPATGASVTGAAQTYTTGATMNPARAAMISGAGVTRPAPDADLPARPLKRARVEKLPGGQLYSEIDWMSLHPDPITVAVQLPAMGDKPEWRLDGSVLGVPGVPVNATFGTLREHIKRTLDADLPVSRLQLTYGGRVMNNSASLASVNLGEGDVVVMAVKKK